MNGINNMRPSVTIWLTHSSKMIDIYIEIDIEIYSTGTGPPAHNVCAEHKA